MAQQLRVLAALPEDPGKIPSTHMAVHNCLIQVLGDMTSHTDIHAGKTPMHI